MRPSTRNKYDPKADKPWTIDSLPWAVFDAQKVDPELLAIVKAAALVEYNARDYATYLSNVFSSDEAFKADIRQWSAEETQHGAALGAWAEKADPSFNFRAAFARYTAGYRINIDAKDSIRGSKASELVARCIVETGTSSYYSALGHASGEPVLKALCANIVADELRHYKLFHTYLSHYLKQEKLGRFRRLHTSLGRITESEDDELAFAFFAANAPSDAVYERATYTAAYMTRAYPLYRGDHLERMVAMVFRACGFTLPRFLRRAIASGAFWLMQRKNKEAMSDGRKARLNKPRGVMVVRHSEAA